MIVKAILVVTTDAIVKLHHKPTKAVESLALFIYNLVRVRIAVLTYESGQYLYIQQQPVRDARQPHASRVNFAWTEESANSGPVHRLQTDKNEGPTRSSSSSA